MIDSRNYSLEDRELHILNLNKSDYFILLRWYNIFILLQLLLFICYYFYKDILN